MEQVNGQSTETSPKDAAYIEPTERMTDCAEKLYGYEHPIFPKSPYLTVIRPFSSWHNS
jgi:hypothetical protein